MLADELGPHRIADRCDGVEDLGRETEQIQHLRDSGTRDTEFASEVRARLERPVGKPCLPFASQRYGVAARLNRLVEYPSSPREHVMAAWLAVGKEIAVVSHESALDLLNLSDIIPNAVHLTVPRARRSVPSIPGVRIHTTTRPIGPGERWMRDGMAVTSATRSILDAAEAGSAPEQIEMAIMQAVERGQVIAEELHTKATVRGRRVATLIEGALQMGRDFRRRGTGVSVG